MTPDTAAIRARAEKAKHSPWKSMPQKGEPGHCFVAQIFDENGHALADLQPTIIPELASDTAAHIAGLHPEIAISLCDEIDRLRADNDRLRAELARATADALEDAAKIVEPWLRPQELRLRAGEMSAQEERTVTAVLNSIAAALRAAAQKEIANR